MNTHIQTQSQENKLDRDKKSTIAEHQHKNALDTTDKGQKITC